MDLCFCPFKNECVPTHHGNLECPLASVFLDVKNQLCCSLVQQNGGKTFERSGANMLNVAFPQMQPVYRHEKKLWLIWQFLSAYHQIVGTLLRHLL